jgi:hypothetical protein
MRWAKDDRGIDRWQKRQKSKKQSHEKEKKLSDLDPMAPTSISFSVRVCFNGILKDRF